MWHSPHSSHAPQCSMETYPPVGGASTPRRLISPLSPVSPLSPLSPLPGSQSPTPSGSYPHHQPRRPLLNFPPPPAYPPPQPGAGHHVVQLHHPPPPQLQPIREDLGLPGPSTHRGGGPQPSTSWDIGEIMPNDYSYAYYEPGPPTKHMNVPHRHPITGCYRDRVSRHVYLTRYGTEENIYEEISDVARARMMMRPTQQQSLLSLNQSIVDEELRRVQHRHRKVLGELNLSVEAMLMPSTSQDSDTDKELDDQLSDLLTVGPTDELLSPAAAVDLDSGFSGSSSGTSYVGSMRRVERYKGKSGGSTGGGSGGYVAGSGGAGGGAKDKEKDKDGRGFWRKGWKRIAGGVGGLARQQNDSPRGRSSGCWDDSLPRGSLSPSTVSRPGSTATPPGGTPGGTPSRAALAAQRTISSEDSWCSGSEGELSSEDESDRSAASSTSEIILNVCSLLLDSPRGRSSGCWDDSLPRGSLSPSTTSTVSRPGSTATPPGGTPGGTPSRAALAAQRTISSEDSWCSGSDGELSSEDESDRSAASSTRSNGQLRSTLSKARTLCDKFRSQSRGSCGGQGVSSGGSGSSASLLPGDMSPAAAAAQGRLSRWFSIRRGSSHQYDVEATAATEAVRSNGQLRSTLSKARTLCDKFRSQSRGSCGGQGVSSGGSGSSASLLPGDMSPAAAAAQGRLSRWFSIRRGSSHQYDVEATEATEAVKGSPKSKMPLLPELEEEANTFAGCMFQQRRQVPPSLPPPPPNITPQQQKRRMIIAAIVHSENSYVATLQRLVNDYKKPLEESSPPILSGSKISTLFHRLPEILQCHTLFRIALAECVRNWDRDEKIGDVFVGSFSKAIVLDIYSGFINNFSVAMDLAKMEAKRKSALADFLKVKQISSHDRLSFFGLMVKPVQRFPQFILFLQDLLKHTPQGHHDRMSLQLALTQLESLAELLNERKREAEQCQAFREMLRHIGGKFTARPLTDANRYLLREDNVTQLEFNQCGMITKSKSRRLLLLNDLVVCVSVAPKASDDFGASERLTLKWTYPVNDVEIQDTSASPTLTRLLTAGMNKGASLRSNGSTISSDSVGGLAADNLCTEMSNLMHDFEVMSRVQDLVSSLKGSYKDMTVENTRRILNSIQTSIQRKDEEMAWVDSCCLQLVVKNKGKEEVYTFQTDNPSVKKEWITELRLAQLALDPNNSPAWDVPEQEQRPSTKMPLFVRSQPVFRSQHQTEVRCGCFYTIGNPKPTRRKGRTSSYLWVCTSDGISSHIAILNQHQQQAGCLKDVASFDLVETQVTAMEFVRGTGSFNTSVDTVWMGTDSRRLLLYSAGEPEKQEELASCTVPAIIVQIKYHCDAVFVALGNGSLMVFRRNSIDGTWLLKEPQSVSLGTDSVSCILPINLSVYAACGKKVWVLSGVTGEVQKSFSVQHEHVGNVNLMAHSGIGLWISLKNSSTVCLYHTETFKHLQDINIASNVMRVTTGSDTCGSRDCVNNNKSVVNVTALMACKGLLWVGTNVGICLTIPLPRLEGVPIISGRVNISYHAHFGPISFILALQPKTHVNMPVTTKEEDKPEEKEDKKVMHQLNDSSVPNMAAKLKQQLTSSPVVLRRRRSKDLDMSRLSKTLPRGLGSGFGMLSMSTTSSQSSGDTCDVYGLYGELMYVKDYEGDDHELGDTIYESLRRSDPELAAIPGKVSTLDRRLKMKVSRPRSLDLSNWSVDSRSSSLYTSSGSEESMAVRNGRSISRNNSNASRTLNGVCEDTIEEVVPVTNTASQKVNTKTLPKNSTSEAPRRTVITLMGGRGYVNWRQPCCTDKQKHSSLIREPNNTDAHIVIWELKL